MSEFFPFGRLSKLQKLTNFAADLIEFLLNFHALL